MGITPSSVLSGMLGRTLAQPRAGAAPEFLALAVRSADVGNLKYGGNCVSDGCSTSVVAAKQQNHKQNISEDENLF